MTVIISGIDCAASMRETETNGYFAQESAITIVSSVKGLVLVGPFLNKIYCSVAPPAWCEARVLL